MTVVTSATDTSLGSKTGQTSWGPTEGSSFALVKTDGQNNYQQLCQTFSASAGDVLTLDYFWDSQDAIRGGGKGNDIADGGIFLGALTSPANSMPSLPVVQEVFHYSVAEDGSANPRYGTDWTSFRYTFEDTGVYTRGSASGAAVIP